MTILDLLNSRISNNVVQKKALEIIKDNYTSSVNNNYNLIVNENGDVLVKIPSLQNRGEYVYTPITEYDYPLLMCMKIEEINNSEYYEYIINAFMKEYRDNLQLFIKDVVTVDKLMNDIKSTKKHIEYITYISIIAVILGGLSLCIFSVSQTAKHVLTLGIISLFILTIIIQFTKENQIKKLIDGYISTIKTDWYNSELRKQYVFLCNFMG